MAAIIGAIDKAQAIKQVINSVLEVTGDPANLWNSICSGADRESLEKMIRQCGGNSIEDSHVLIGKLVHCNGASGLGNYEAYVQKVDVGKGWLEVYWKNDKYNAWKTAKLCWIEWLWMMINLIPQIMITTILNHSTNIIHC